MITLKIVSSASRGVVKRRSWATWSIVSNRSPSVFEDPRGKAFVQIRNDWSCCQDYPFVLDSITVLLSVGALLSFYSSFRLSLIAAKGTSSLFCYVRQMLL